MKIFIYTAAVLFCTTISQGDRCKINVPVTSSTLKCEDKVYHRDHYALDAVNSCGEGKNGTEVTIQHLDCIFEKIGYIVNGFLIPAKLLRGNTRNFPDHYMELTNGTKQCELENSKTSDEKNPYKHVECRMNVFKTVCKHETCDWINTLD
ncbi:unnamed protein product [Allacma fusca]|uniref:Uncharacterized protein n=1 Tax=Allacma fusca TaxID=39272 RepID=A0A8J2JHN7_9HEXA|nr:unnamed protein product [Allacma fusca]